MINANPDGGGGRLRPPRKEIDAPPEQTVPPARTGGIPPTQTGSVTEDSVAELAKKSLPQAADFSNYVTFSKSELATLAAQVVAASGVNIAQIESAMQASAASVASSEKELNKKSVGAAAQAATSWPALPGTGTDGTCGATFDVNDLTLRGRKSMLAKQFHLPAIFPEIVFGDGQVWTFGQKVEYRQEWRHEGFTLGELISSLSLLPNEELTLEVSSWQRTKREIEEEQDTETKQQLERELKRTDEESAASEAMANNGWSLSASGSVSYGPVSASAAFNATGSLEQRTEQAERHVAEETTKAANQVSLRRAVRMTQTAEEGSESRTTRRIKNPNACRTVTFNFFQIVKLYDVQLRLMNDAPTVMLPGLFPGFYTPATPTDPLRPVVIPYWLIESFNSPAVFLTRFFEVDRDLSQDINGWGLRVRIDAGRTTAQRSAPQLAEALIVAVKYLLKLNPADHVQALGAIVANYFQGAVALRSRNAATYGVGRGRSEQITTPGIYVDSLLGHCTACEEYVEAARYIDATRQNLDANRIKAENDLLELERQRRTKLLEMKKYDPFDDPVKAVRT